MHKAYLPVKVHAFADYILVASLVSEVFATASLNESSQSIAGDTVSHNSTAWVLLRMQKTVSASNILQDTGS